MCLHTGLQFTVGRAATGSEHWVQLRRGVLSAQVKHRLVSVFHLFSFDCRLSRERTPAARLRRFDDYRVCLFYSSVLFLFFTSSSRSRFSWRQLTQTDLIPTCPLSKIWQTIPKGADGRSQSDDNPSSSSVFTNIKQTAGDLWLPQMCVWIKKVLLKAGCSQLEIPNRMKWNTRGAQRPKLITSSDVWSTVKVRLMWRHQSFIICVQFLHVYMQ